MITTLSIITYRIYKIKRRERGRKESTYPDEKRSREVSLTKLNIVKINQEPLDIGDAIPPQLILGISHQKWGKHEWRRIHRNLRCILTH